MFDATYGGSIGSSSIASTAIASTGRPAGHKSLKAAAGAFALTGQYAKFQTSHPIPLTGAIATHAIGKLPIASHGTLRFVSMAASVGSFHFTGNAAALKAARKLPAGVGGYTFTGYSAQLRAARFLRAANASYTLTGNDAALVHARPFHCGTGAFNLTGEPAAFRVNHILHATTGNLSLTGSDARLARLFTLHASPGAFLLTGKDVILYARPGRARALFTWQAAATVGPSFGNAAVTEPGFTAPIVKTGLSVGAGGYKQVTRHLENC